ncbi:MAG: 5'/3'-nucleotidase SurE [Anaerolineaceae bacterium]|nr:5'/3'-nucleotidase SurE [Anaerolineaceae bacterium]|tara:strand:- start:34112 stop:34912 length:801 start_codon:yes stop_codon:yes gene_type:complete
MHNNKRLIILTNDDGVSSPGLVAAAIALAPLGRVLVTAPREQQSGAGRSMPKSSDGYIESVAKVIDGASWDFYSISGSPAQVIQRGIFVVSERLPDLVVSGINYGENLGADLTISGTVGAAWEAASYGVPALAVSLQTDMSSHINHGLDVDFAGAIHFTRMFAKRLLDIENTNDVDLLNINVPMNANENTAWKITRQSRKQYFVPTNLSNPDLIQYKRAEDHAEAESDSDICAITKEKVVSITPISIDATARVSLLNFEEKMRTLE